ncbi:uncharacterized protein LOC120681961 isoform X2 [Panicum virgatum]|uniref:uncharacterized protein LOC120681961 isoform X2 n=1 Tax=Panicum virgatum TaxID=38727 RepID=UPI0019D64AE4|nr:uncharacterized protein LOC120681961 isoform X2 [Panicum virgatum]
MLTHPRVPTPVASGVLHVRDLSFLRPRKGDGEADGMTEEQEEEKYFEWRSSLVEKLEGIELNLEGVKFRMTVEIPPSDDFKVMKKSWEDFYSSELLNSRNPVRKIAKRPDTIVVCGVQSRWFADTRVSSKPSTLVTHTIFSAPDHRFLHWTFGRVDRKGLPSGVDFSNIYILSSGPS